ncbi:unnamed protein product, partial [Effrenium voratum]
ESFLLRLSDLFLRKRGLKCGVQALHRNVFCQSRLRKRRKVQQSVWQEQIRLLQACWSAWVRHAEHRRLMKLYQSWADVHWLRTRLGAAWQAWLAWYRKRGKVVAMCSGPQLLAAWRWLRVHAAAHLRPSRSGLLLGHSDVPGRDEAQHTARGHATAPAVPAPWWHAAATELLFGSAPFKAHPHHMKAMREGLLVVFASTLLKKMMAAWMCEVGAIREMTQRTKLKVKHRNLEAWKEQAAKHRHLHERSLQVSNLRCQRTQVRALQHWQHRWAALTQHRRQLCDFDVACWHRSCRRAMTAWLVVRRREATARSLQKATGLRVSHLVFQVWVTQWQRERKESVLLRLSALFLRKRGLKCGVHALHRNVSCQLRLRKLRKARACSRDIWAAKCRGIFEACWSAWVRHAEHRRLMKLYQSWADVHWLRTRLGAAWQAWLAWYRKRGKVVAMCSGPQLLAAWRWLRVHAAAHLRPSRSGLLLGHSDVPGRDEAQHTARGHTTAPAVPAPWWHAAATELLFGSAPFEAHPHHMKAMREGLLVVFASTLLKKMMAAWMCEARAMREMLQHAKLKAKQRSLGAWKAGIAKCRRLRSKSLQVSNRTRQRMQARALDHWQHRLSALTQHRRRLRDFDVECWHRSCRRAMTAWLVVRRREATARSLQKATGLRVSHLVFQALIRLKP